MTKRKTKKKQSFTCDPDPKLLDWYYPVLVTTQRDACLEPIGPPIDKVKPIFPIGKKKRK